MASYLDAFISTQKLEAKSLHLNIIIDSGLILNYNSQLDEDGNRHYIDPVYNLLIQHFRNINSFSIKRVGKDNRVLGTVFEASVKPKLNVTKCEKGAWQKQIISIRNRLIKEWNAQHGQEERAIRSGVA